MSYFDFTLDEQQAKFFMKLYRKLVKVYLLSYGIFPIYKYTPVDIIFVAFKRN